MGAWPDWWPANPVGSAWDEMQANKAAIIMLLWLVGGLAALLLAIYVWRKVE